MNSTISTFSNFECQGQFHSVKITLKCGATGELKGTQPLTICQNSPTYFDKTNVSKITILLASQPPMFTWNDAYFQIIHITKNTNRMREKEGGG